MKNEENKGSSIGSRIRSAREEMGYSQLDLAKKLDFESATAISLIESGERNITINNLEKIAGILHRSVNYFLGKPEKDNVTVEYALRADKHLSPDAKKAILQFIELAKNNKNGK